MMNPTSQMSQNQIDLLKISPEEILDKLDIEYSLVKNRINMKCPVHGGDDEDKCCIFKSGETASNNWVCWSNNCHAKYGRDLIGFIRGVLSFRLNKEISRQYVYREFKDIFNGKNLNYEKKDIVANIFQSKEKKIVKEIDRNLVISSLKIPSVYYLNRGYSKEVLKDYDVGECLSVGKPMYLRATVPVYNDDNKFIGCTGRSIQPECEKCGYYHYENLPCPSNKMEKYRHSKWINSEGFFKSSVLYNLSKRKDIISNTGTIILVEGPGDVWRLEEAGIHNSVAMFGVFLSESQLDLLLELSISNIVVMTDLDRAGSSVLESVYKKCGRMFNIHRIKPSKKDVGDMTAKEVISEIKPLIERFYD